MSSTTKPTVPQAPNPPRDAGTKRKRGRPPNAQRRDIPDAPQLIAAAPEEYDADADDAGRPRKRGRPLRSVNGGGAAVEDGAAPAKGAGRRSPRGKENRPLDDKADAVQAVAQDAKRKRGRPALGSREQRRDETPEVPVVNGTARRRTQTQRQTHELNGSEEVSKAPQPEVGLRRRRRARDRLEEPDQEPESEPEPEPEQPVRRRRGRPPQQDQRERESVVEQQEEDDQPRLRRRRRPSIQAPPPAEAPSQAPKSAAKSADASVEAASEPTKRGRKDSKPKGPSMEKPTQEQSKPKGRRSGKSAIADTTEKTTDDKPRNNEDRHDNDNDDDDDGAPPSPEKPYTHIAPHTHRVRQSEIKAKWTPLSESSLSSVSSILRLAHRPILQRLSNTQQRREHTAAALRLVANRITRKIARGLPFPPPAMAGRASSRSAAAAGANDDDGGRAAELDFEGVLDAKQALERQLDPALHAVDLLRREKEKLERELEKDYEVLRNLDLSARAQGRDHRGLVRRAHVLAPAPETAARRNEDHEKDGLVPQRQASSSGGLFDNLQDEEEDIKDLGLQLGSHAESIRNNLRQTEDIMPQLSRSRAALQDVLFRYLDQEQYEHVLFG